MKTYISSLSYEIRHWRWHEVRLTLFKGAWLFIRLLVMWSSRIENIESHSTTFSCRIRLINSAVEESTPRWWKWWHPKCGTKKHKKYTKSRRVPANGPMTITDLLYQYPCCPPEAYKNVKEYYMNNNLNYLCANDKYVNSSYFN